MEGLNTKVRRLIGRAYGFRAAEAALALVMLAAGPIETQAAPRTAGRKRHRVPT